MTMYTDVPLNGYQVGDIWHYKEGQDWPGKNLLSGFPSDTGETLYTNNQYFAEYNTLNNLNRLVPFDQTKEYTVSYDAEVISTNAAELGVSIGYANSAGYFVLDGSTFYIPSVAKGTYHISRTFKMDKDLSKVTGTIASTATLNFALRFARSSASHTSQVIYRNFKIEEGSTATPWQPGPEDLLPQGATEGYFIAGRNSESFDFNDWSYYSQPIQNFIKLLWFSESIEV